MTIRRGLLLGLTLTSAGCGFHPLYQAGTFRSASLATVYVDLIPDRTGQLLRQALQTRLEGASTGVAKQYTLSVSYSETPQGLAVQPDNSTTRTRDVGVAIWSLHPADNATRQIVGGTVRSIDGYNVIDEQFFYAETSEEAAQRRLASALADQIVLKLAAFFDKTSKPG